MRKKLLIDLTAVGLVFGVGTAVYAATSNAGNGAFEQVLPAMKQMHPNLTEQQLQDMFNSCQTNTNMQ